VINRAMTNYSNTKCVGSNLTLLERQWQRKMDSPVLKNWIL
jgi:hypothetical protein